MNIRKASSRLVVTLTLLACGALAGARAAMADDCMALSGNPPGAECVVSTAVTASGTYNLLETLHVTATGKITVPPLAGGNTLTLNISGGLSMDTGAQILGDSNSAGGVGAAIDVEATGDILLNGDGVSGAKITANQSAGSCTGAGSAGNITLATSGGDVTTEPGSVVSADAKCSAGAIRITAANGSIDIDGLVESRSTLTGTGLNQRPGGGPITIIAKCDLTVSDTGVVSSRGADPGADLVHLEACAVTIDGLVESTGPGHAIPINPPNHCATGVNSGKPANSTACVEVWAGSSLTIDSTVPHTGEINTDIGFSGGNTGNAWVDLFANGPIGIIGDTVAPYAVHSNMGVTNSHGGQITVKSLLSSIGTSGLAVQANATTSGGKGGTEVFEADTNLNFGAASIQAEGSGSGGGGQSGGSISGRSYHGTVLGAAPGELNASGGPPAGSVTLQGCGTILNPADGVAYTGTATPAFLNPGDSCAGDPSVTVPLPPANCGDTCNQQLLCPPGACSVPPHSSPTVVTDCSLAGGFVTKTSSWTQINLPAADVVLRCALVELAGTDGVRIIAHSVVVDGPGGGSITSDGKNGIRLDAGTQSPSVCDAGATVDIESSNLLDNNSNGNIMISACGDIVVNDSNLKSKGATVSVTSATGQICANNDFFFGNRVILTAYGDLRLTGSHVQTIGPRDLQKFVSVTGSVLAGGPPPCAPNGFAGEGESNFIASAAGIVDLQNACIDIAENIDITGDGSGFNCGVDTIVNLRDSEVRNDFGKTGFITITGCGGTGIIDINNALIVDEGKNGGGPDPNRVASMNGGTATVNVNCAASSVPTCNARPVSATRNPVSADPAGRASHAVVGVPRCDT